METLRNSFLDWEYARELETVSSGIADGRLQIELAERHLLTASQINRADCDAILQISYAAARKSLQAVLSCVGLRVKQPPGNHWTFVKLVRLPTFASDGWNDLAWIRLRRNDAEYFTINSPSIAAQEAEDALVAERLMVADARRIIEQLRK